MPLALTSQERKMPESINLTLVEIIKIERTNKGTLERKLLSELATRIMLSSYAKDDVSSLMDTDDYGNEPTWISSDIRPTTLLVRIGELSPLLK